MGKHKVAEAASAARERLFHRRSLLWIIPERTARWTGWLLVVLACLVPLILLAARALTWSPQEEQEALKDLLAKRLAIPVSLQLEQQEGRGHYRLSAVRIGRGTTALQALAGSYQAPQEDMPGRLDFTNGRLQLNLEDWTKRPSRNAMRLLFNTREHKDLRSLSLSNFTVELHFGSAPLTLTDAVGRADLTEQGDIQGHLVGRTDSGPLSFTFRLADDLQSVTVRGSPLPWARKLLAPTLGGTLTALLEDPGGELTVSSSLNTGSEDDNWKLELAAPIDLERLPEALGLGPVTGKPDLKISRAFGHLGATATLAATLSLPDNTTATVTDSALRNLGYLLTGRWTPGLTDDKTRTIQEIEFSVIVTREHIYLTAEPENLRTGVFGPAGAQLLAIPLGEAIPIDEFTKRLETLHRLWAETHAS